MLSCGSVSGWMSGAVLLALVAAWAQAEPPAPAAGGRCAGVLARTAGGWLCGERRQRGGRAFASFRGVPYARQPVGELRFKELQPLRSWDGVLQATEEGPPCPQRDILYGKLMPELHRTQYTEACIYANVHVPIEALPSVDNQSRLPRNIQPPYTVAEDQRTPSQVNGSGLPILVFIHGGGFAFGSGGQSLHGPEPLVAEKLIVITFNYRLNVFGFLSLNSSWVPGNNGLRDMVALLRWVRRNARGFGGDPGDVTIAGQSAGASAAHLLTLSPAARGLFKRAILMSGTALPSFFTTTPAYSQIVSQMFLSALGITATDPGEVHQKLVDTPLEKLMAVNDNLQEQFGLVVFFPVVESPHPGVEVIIDQDPEALIAAGRGSDIPLLVGFANNECEVFRPRFRHLDILKRLEANPLLALSPKLIFTTPPEVAMSLVEKVQRRYFDEVPTEDEYIKQCSDSLFEYPALKLGRYRSESSISNEQSAPMYLYEFGYQPEYSVLKEALGLQYEGATHIEDQTFVLNASSVPVPCTCQDSDVRHLMVQFVTNFVRFSTPVGQDHFDWPPVGPSVQYQSITSANPRPSTLTPRQTELLAFFDSIQGA